MVGKFDADFAGSVARRWKAAQDAYFRWHRQGEASGFRAGAVQMVPLGPYLEVANMISMQGVMGESGDSPLCYVALAKALDELLAAIEVCAVTQYNATECDSISLSV